MVSPQDLAHLTTALHLSEGAVGLSEPNPRVGCVLVSAQGQVLGQGHTQAVGGPHAEVVALRAAQAQGHPTAGSTAFVTLEPCSHFGRTPPCCDALVAAGVARVVVATTDPNPLVAGLGLARLRAAGVVVNLLPPDHPLAVAVRALNVGFFSRMERGLPWVRMKVAASMDGTTALHNGASQWITGPEARADGHAWRRRATAVLTGIGTVEADNPRLDVRLVPTTVQPWRVVVDARLAIPPTAQVLQPPGQVLVYTATPPEASAEQREALHALGVAVIEAPGGTGGKVDLKAMLHDLAQRGVNELHLEAGHKLNGSFLREGLVDELLLYLAPQLLGPGAGLAHLGPFDRLSDGPRFHFVDTAMVGPDLRLRAQKTA